MKSTILCACMCVCMCVCVCTHRMCLCLLFKLNKNCKWCFKENKAKRKKTKSQMTKKLRTCREKNATGPFLRRNTGPRRRLPNVRTPCTWTVTEDPAICHKMQQTDSGSPSSIPNSHCSPQRASLHSQLQQDGQGQVLVLQRDTSRPFGPWGPMNIPEMTGRHQAMSEKNSI